MKKPKTKKTKKNPFQISPKPRIEQIISQRTRSKSEHGRRYISIPETSNSKRKLGIWDWEISNEISAEREGDGGGRGCKVPLNIRQRRQRPFFYLFHMGEFSGSKFSSWIDSPPERVGAEVEYPAGERIDVVLQSDGNLDRWIGGPTT